MNGTAYEFWLYGIFAILISLFIFFLQTTIRIGQRHKKKIADITFYYLFNQRFSAYYIYEAGCYVLLVVTGIIWYDNTEETLLLYTFIILPLVFEL